jgi:dipeptidyl aminopeptidase/acylaminoacyl peptidase
MAGIERYLGVRMAFNPAYSKATGQWYFLMNLTDTAQIYSISRPGAWPAMLTDYPERVSGLHVAPAQAGLVFLRDRGGNEYHQFYWLDLLSMEVHALTDNPGAVHVFGAFSPDGTRLAYTCTARNGKDYDVYVMSLAAPGDTRLVLTREGHWEVAAWAADGGLILRQVVSNAEQSLWRCHPGQGEPERLTPGDQPAVYRSPALASDGSLYVMTDYQRDFLAVARIEEPGRLTWVVEEAAEIDGLDVDPNGQTLAYVVNRDGFAALHLRDLSEGRDRHVSAFDRSVIVELAWDDAGRTLAVTHSGPDHNLNVSLVDVASGTVERLTQAPMTGLDPARLVAPTVIHYPSFDGQEIPAYVYRPPLAGALPVVISVHGGPEAQERPYFSGWYQYLLAHGYALVAPNVRGSAGYGKAYVHLDDREKRMDSVRDIERLVEWIRKAPGLDGERIAIMGGSYGGFMVLSSITQYPDLFRAAIDIVGIANLESFLENTSEWRRALREAEYGYLATDREFLRRFSPIHYVDRIRAPLFVVHGKNDPRVPLNEAEQIVTALKQRQQPVEFRVYADEGHGVVKLRNRLQLYPELVAFLDRHLRA